MPSDGSAVLVYGVKVIGEWRYPRFNVQLAEYDIKQQNITGNCFRFNRTEAEIPALPGGLEYFAFEVPAGRYGYSPFNGARLRGEYLSLDAPAGTATYVGDFVFGIEQSVVLTRDIERAKVAIRTRWPGMERELALANAVPARAPSPFLCTP